jgi:glutamate/tyrosine decarboxylase-like PLP-dependent enzyme
VLYRDSALRRHQFFVKPDWLGGAYASAAMLGTRSGGGIASAWAALMMLGENGYMDLVRRTLSYRDRLWKGIRAIDGLELVGEPDMSVFCFRSTKHDIFSIGAKLEKRGWRIDRQNNPPAIHMIVTPNHRLAVSAFLRDLKNIVATEPLSKGKAPAAVGLYGVTSSQTSGANPVESLYRGLESNYE